MSRKVSRKACGSRSARGQGPTECFQVISMSMGAISTWVIGVDVDGPEFAARDAALEHAGHHAAAAVDDFFLVKAGQSGKLPASAMTSLMMPEVLVAPSSLPPGMDHLAQQLGAVAVELGDHVLGLADDGHDGVAHHGLEQLFLVGVIQVQRALRHAGAARDVFQPGGGKAPFDEQVEGRRQQFLGPRILAPLPAWLGVKRTLHEYACQSLCKYDRQW